MSPPLLLIIENLRLLDFDLAFSLHRFGLLGSGHFEYALVEFGLILASSTVSGRRMSSITPPDAAGVDFGSPRWALRRTGVLKRTHLSIKATITRTAKRTNAPLHHRNVDAGQC